MQSNSSLAVARETLIYRHLPAEQGSAANIGHLRWVILEQAANHIRGAACAEKARMALFSASLINA